MKEVYFLYRKDIKCGRCGRFLNPKNYEYHTNGPKCMQNYHIKIKKERWYNIRKKYLDKIYNDATETKYISNKS